MTELEKQERIKELEDEISILEENKSDTQYQNFMGKDVSGTGGDKEETEIDAPFF